MRVSDARLRRLEESTAGLRQKEGPFLVVVEADESGVGHFSSVCGGPYLGQWPESAFEPFGGNEADMYAYFERHGWDPPKLISLIDEVGARVFHGWDKP